MIGPSNLITVGVEIFAAVDRHLDRQKLLTLATNRLSEHNKSNNSRNFVIVKSPKEINQLRKLKKDSCVVFVDCALELCSDEKELEQFWNELKRVSGTSDLLCKDLFVCHIQHWSSTRLFLDPKIRFIILEAPPKTIKLKYKHYGKRNSVLSDNNLSKKNDNIKKK
jgi:hypothetical protein